MRIFGIYYPDSNTTESTEGRDIFPQAATDGPGLASIFQSMDGPSKADSKPTGRATGHNGNAGLIDAGEDGHPAADTPASIEPGQDDTDVPADIPDKADESPADVAEDLHSQYSPEVKAMLSNARARLDENLRRQALEERKRQIEAQQAELLAQLPEEVVRASKNKVKHGGTLSEAMAVESRRRWDRENKELMAEFQRKHRANFPERNAEVNRKAQRNYRERQRQYDPQAYREWVQRTGELHKQAYARKKAEKEAARLAEEEEKKRLQAEEEERKTEQDPAQEKE